MGTIYNVLFGLNGNRAAKILSFIRDGFPREAIGGTKSWQLEVSLLFISRLVDLNSTALVQEHLQEQAKRFEAALALSMNGGAADSKLHRAKAYLERLQHRLSVGQSLPVSLPGKTNQAPLLTAIFVPIRDVTGGRHDNDHADICEVKIMPTFQEIESASTDYLPVIDPPSGISMGLVTSKKAKRQKQCRRKATLMTKESEYSKMCDADLCLGIRLREKGQVYIFQRMLWDFGTF